VFPSEVERVLLSFAELTPEWRIILRRGRDGMDQVVVEVEGVSSSSRGAAARAADRLREELGLTLQVTILAPGTLPRSEGKAMRVVDEREDPDAPAR
jgi:phenylacetate-CoA ligase